MCCLQTPEKKGEAGEAELLAETSSEPPDSSNRGPEGAGLSAEQPFIKLSQEEYGEHHSSIMHCRSAFNIWFNWSNRGRDSRMTPLLLLTILKLLGF